MADNSMLAAYLMQQRQQQSPLGALAAGINAGMGPTDPYGMAQNSGAPAGALWGVIGDFLTGNRRKKPYDKMDPGMPKDPADDSGNLASSLGVYSP